MTGVRDINVGKEQAFITAFPGKTGLKGTTVSILTLMGIALIGFRERDVLEWELPSGNA